MPLRSHRCFRFRPLVWLGSVCVLALSGSLYGHGGYHERIAALTAELENDASNPLAHLELGNLHGQHGDLQLALADLERVDKLAPGKFLTDLSRGQAWLTAGDFAQAKSALDRQLLTHPECAQAWLLRARARRGVGENAASLADYREALQRTAAPEPDLFQEVADALAAQGYQAEALQVLAAGIVRLGQIPVLTLRALDLEIAMKDFDAALERVEAARRSAPRPEPWMARRASVLAQAGRSDEARAAWAALVQHLEGLPERERGSFAMSKLMEEARQAQDAMSSAPQPHDRER